VSAFKRFAVPVVLLMAVAFLLIQMRFRLHPLVTYLIVINLGTFLYYGLDKLCALRRCQRVPELLLHLMALSGGSPGALFAQRLFVHKVSKTKFLLLYWLIVLIQLALLYMLFYTDLLKTIF
jgi:uncharacterized membrane protein YsdA (DUF1294 family)